MGQNLTASDVRFELKYDAYLSGDRIVLQPVDMMGLEEEDGLRVDGYHLTRIESRFMLKDQIYNAYFDEATRIDMRKKIDQIFIEMSRKFLEDMVGIPFEGKIEMR